MLIDLGFALTFLALFIAMWDIHSEFLRPTIYVIVFCLLAGFIMETFL